MSVEVPIIQFDKNKPKIGLKSPLDVLFQKIAWDLYKSTLDILFSQKVHHATLPVILKYTIDQVEEQRGVYDRIRSLKF